MTSDHLRSLPALFVEADGSTVCPTGYPFCSSYFGQSLINLSFCRSMSNRTNHVHSHEDVNGEPSSEYASRITLLPSVLFSLALNDSLGIGQVKIAYSGWFVIARHCHWLHRCAARPQTMNPEWELIVQKTSICDRENKVSNRKSV